MTRSSFWKAVSLKLRAIRATCTQAGSPRCLDNNTKHIQEKNPRFLPRKKLSESIFYKTPWKGDPLFSPFSLASFCGRKQGLWDKTFAVGKMWVHIPKFKSSMIPTGFQNMDFPMDFPRGFHQKLPKDDHFKDHLRALAHSCQLPVQPNSSGPVFRMNPLLPQIRFQMRCVSTSTLR